MGHRRLSIIDLDQRASQPMQSRCGRYVIVYNGEIYNYKNIRQELSCKGVTFETNSDTEVLLELFRNYGEDMLKHIRGMFAFTIWDSFEKRAFAARDAYGIKPLYIAKANNTIFIGSQVKALLASGLIDLSPDMVGQAGFWMLGSVPEPHTLYRDIKALPAGNCLWIEYGSIVRQRCWFDISNIWREAANEGTARFSESDIKKYVSECVRESVAFHMIADVPVAVFLSGGIDSGAISGLMIECGAKNLIGITISYEEYRGQSRDEVPVASLIASHYGIRHHVRIVSREEFLMDLPRIMDAMDQPSIDGINTWYASKAVKELGLKVVVSGVGGDELFLGYNLFNRLPNLVRSWRNISRVPGIYTLASYLMSKKAVSSGKSRWKLAPEWLKSIPRAWWLIRSSMSPADAEFALGVKPNTLLNDFNPEEWIQWMTGPLADDPTFALAQIESTTYLRNQLLKDSDWASMDHSIELRTPLVDAKLLYSIKDILPHMHRFKGKILLAESPKNPLPKEIINRRKTGFSIPISDWICDRFGKHTSWQMEVAKNYGMVR